MAPPIAAAALLKALREEGCKVAEVGDWPTHNRNGQGAWGPVHGVMVHHTVTRGSKRTVEIVRDGYDGLPGPLSLGAITKDGTVHLVGLGRANHAGLGDSDVLDAVIAERRTPSPTKRDTDGNARFYGFECENLGDGSDPWPAAQLDAIERASAAICRYHGWNEWSVIGHLEWTNRKIDPRGFTMDSMRGRVGERLEHPAGWNLEHPAGWNREDDMQPSDKLPIGNWLKNRFPDQEGLQDGEISVSTALASGYGWSRIAADNSARILAQLKAQQATIDKLVEAVAAGPGADVEALKAEIREAIATVGAEVRDAVDGIEATVSVDVRET